jgi:hypothetical protein
MQGEVPLPRDSPVAHCRLLPANPRSQQGTGLDLEEATLGPQQRANLGVPPALLGHCLAHRLVAGKRHTYMMRAKENQKKTSCEVTNLAWQAPPAPGDVD